MTIEDALQELKQQEPTFLQVAKKKINHKNTYICQCGHGQHGDGICHNPKDGRWYCFGCGAKGDVIDWWQRDKSINDWQEALKQCCDYYGIILDDYKPQRETYALQKDEITAEYLQKIHKDLKEAPKHLEAFLQGAKSYRGISKETLIKYGVGYLTNWHSFNKDTNKERTDYPSNRLVIPTSINSYLARDTNPNGNKNFRAIKQGNAVLFNDVVLEFNENMQPVFIVEGELDALSIIDCGGQAVALGSISYKNKLYYRIDNIKDFNIPLILALDSDEAGQQAQETMKQELEARGIFYTTHYWQGGKDANEVLVRLGQEAFIDEIKETIAETTEQALNRQPICYITTSYDEAEQIKALGLRAVSKENIYTLQENIPSYFIDLTQDSKIELEKMTPITDSNYTSKNVDDYSKETLLELAQKPLEEIKKASQKEDNQTENFIKSHSGANVLTLLQNERQETRKPISTGIIELDEALAGGIFDGLYVIGGTTGLGKSNFAIQIADAMAENGQQEADGTITKRDILYFSLEMPKQEVVARTLARLANIIKGTVKNEQGADYRTQAIQTRDILDGKNSTWTKAPQGEYNQEIYEKAINSYKKTIQPNMYYYDSTDNIYNKDTVVNGVKYNKGEYKGAFTVEDILQVAREHKEVTGQAPILFVDYLQLLESDTVKDERSKTKHDVLSLKEYCIKENTTVFVITSFARSNYNREADIDSGKEAGEIEYTANVYIGLSLKVVMGFDEKKPHEIRQAREEAEKQIPQEMKVAILKNRYGSKKSLYFGFYPVVNKWVFLHGEKEEKERKEYERIEKAKAVKEQKRLEILAKSNGALTNDGIEWDETLKKWKEKEVAVGKLQERCNSKPTDKKKKEFVKKYSIQLDINDPEQLKCIVWQNRVLLCDMAKLEEVKKLQEQERQSQLDI